MTRPFLPPHVTSDAELIVGPCTVAFISRGGL